MNASETLKKGNLDIGWTSSWFDEFVQGKTIEEVAVPTFWTLPSAMKDQAIIADPRTHECTLNDVYAFLKNPPEGTKDGNWNLFYIKDTGRVVFVWWGAGVREWFVDDDWYRDDEWYAGSRVFSPATDTVSLDSEPLSLTLEKAIELVKLKGYKVIREM